MLQDPTKIDRRFGEKLLHILQPLAIANDGQENLDNLAKSIGDHFKADGCWILHYPASEFNHVVASYAETYALKSIAAELTSHRPPNYDEPRMWRTPLMPTHQVIVVNTYYQQRVDGCIVVATKKTNWTDENRLLLQVAADYVAINVAHSLYQEQAEFAKAYPQMQLRLTQAISEREPIDRLFDLVLTDLLKSLNLERGMVLGWKHRKDKSTGDLSQDNLVRVFAIADRHSPEPPPHPAKFSLTDSHLCVQAAAAAPGAALLDYHRQKASAIDLELFHCDRVSHHTFIPLFNNSQRLWGWLVLQHQQLRRWHQVEFELLRCPIYQIALSKIQRSSLHKAESLAQSRRSQVKASLNLQTKLHDASRKQMDKLRRNNDLKDEFVNTVSHELRTPLTSMKMAIAMLRTPDLDADRRDRYLTILEQQCQREIELVNNLLALQQLESQEKDFRPTPVDLNAVVRERATAASSLWPSARDLCLNLHLPTESPQIYTDADSLGRILDELLLNAGKFALPHTGIDLQVSKISPERVEIAIANTSKPVPDEDLASLFDKFHRGAGSTQQAIPGTGLGLALVKSLVEHIQAEIEVKTDITRIPVPGEGEPKTNICFKILLPIALDTV